MARIRHRLGCRPGDPDPAPTEMTPSIHSLGGR
jgi:hypothetical protein